MRGELARAKHLRLSTRWPSIAIGLIVGVVAKLLMPGRDPGGMIVTILLGIGGALVGGFLGRMLGWYGEADPVGFLMAVMGAILVLFVFRKLSPAPRVGEKGGS